MPNTTLSQKINIGGRDINFSKGVSSDAQSLWQPDIPATITASSWTQSTKTAVVPTGHGLIVGYHVDLYWSAGVRYGCKVKTVTPGSGVASIELEDDVAGGMTGGSSYPANSTQVYLSKVTSVAVAFEADDVKALVVSALGYDAVIQFSDGSTSYSPYVLEPDSTSSTDGFSWVPGVFDNPLDGLTITSALVSTSAPSVNSGGGPVFIGVAFDSTP
jgi:hypothetical protein